MEISEVLLSPLLPHFIVSNNPDPLDTIAKVLREEAQVALASAVAHYPHWEIVSFVPEQTSSAILNKSSYFSIAALQKNV